MSKTKAYKIWICHGETAMIRRGKKSFTVMVICAFLVLGETTPAIAQEKSRSVLDLLHKYQTEQSKVKNIQNNARVVHFPKDRSLGSLATQDFTAPCPTLETRGHYYVKYGEYLGPAQGDVVAPPGKRLLLSIRSDAWQDLSPLSKLRPDDLYYLEIQGSPFGPEPDDRCMRYLGGLTGLKALEIFDGDISRKGLQFIGELKSLNYLGLSSQKLSDNDMSLLAGFDSLEILSLGVPVTDEGLQHLASLKSLKQLSVWVKNVRGPGLAYLAKLPRLEYLCLGASFEDKCKFNESGLAYLKDIPSLKKLYIFWQLPITDAGMAHVANLTGLEELDIAELPISDAGLAHLKSLSALKKLNLGYKGSRITEKGLVYLKQMKSLESLTLPPILTDAGLAEITEFDKLKHLCIGGKISDAGLGYLTKLQHLETLNITNNKDVTNVGVAHIAKLTNLKELTLSSDKLTDDSLTALGAVKSLKKLYLSGAGLTTSGLSNLNPLSELTVLRVWRMKRDESPLDIGRLTNLEELILFPEIGWEFGDKDLACLAKLTRLKNLQMRHGGISNTGLAHLAGLASLTFISIGGPGVTDEGLQYLIRLDKLGSLVISGNFTDKAFSYLEQFKGLKYVKFTARAKTNFSRSALDRFNEKRPDIKMEIQP